MIRLKYLITVSLLFSSAIYSNQYHGQFLQDKFLNEHVFKNKRNGTFIDVGAYDGVTDSNSYFFEKELGWKGICVEPIKELYEKIKSSRKCICINACILDKELKQKFVKYSMPNGYITGLSKLINQDQDYAVNDLISEVIEIDCYLLETILQKNNMYDIDYVSLDVEGVELAILKTINFKKFNINVFTIENNNEDETLREFMKSKGYSLIARLGVDDVFKKN